MKRRLCVFAVDPGKTTGIAAAQLNLGRGKTVRGTLKRALERGAVEIDEIRGEPWEQGHELVKRWTDFRFTCNVTKQVPLDCVVFVMESFQLRQRSAELQPVEINASVRTLMLKDWHEVEYQTASAAKGFATNERLKRWGVWVKGDHKRDAWRHVAARVAKEFDA